MKLAALLLLLAGNCLPTVLPAQTTALQAGDSIEKKLLKGETHIYTIALQKGEYADCIVLQKGVDLAVDVIDPAGKKLQTIDSPNGNDGPEPVSIVADKTGTYQLHIYAMLDQSSVTDSVSREKFAEQNQGDYAVNHFSKLSVSAYKKKLAKQEADKTVFAKWLGNNARELKTVDAGNGSEDLQILKETFKNVTVVGLGEATHGTSEFFRMKHRLLEFLVKEMGFTSFYIEASMTRCRYINDYVLYGKGNLDTATVIQGFTTWRVEEVRDMIEWLKKYNEQVASDKKIKFLGYDLQINDVGWKELKQFYTAVKPATAVWLDSLKKQAQRVAMLSNGNAINQAEGEQLFKKVYQQSLYIMNDLVLNGGQYQYTTGKDLYDENLMNIKLIIQEIESYKDGYNDRRDYYMAQNIMHLLNQEKAGAKVVVWAHNAHTGKIESPGFGSMGHFLSEYLHQQYYAVGFEFYSGSFKTRNLDTNRNGYYWDVVTIGEPAKETLPWYFNQTGKTKLFINFRNAGADQLAVFKQGVQLHYFGSGYSPASNIITSSMQSPGSFDGMIYIKESSAAKSFDKLKPF